MTFLLSFYSNNTLLSLTNTLSNFPKVVKATDSDGFRFTISVGFARTGANPVVVAQFIFWSLSSRISTLLQKLRLILTPVSRDSPAGVTEHLVPATLMHDTSCFFDLLF
jgi:hypothetical protein